MSRARAPAWTTRPAPTARAACRSTTTSPGPRAHSATALLAKVCELDASPPPPPYSPLHYRPACPFVVHVIYLIHAACNCNNHATTCTFDPVSNSGVCNCTDNTQGATCDSCSATYYHTATAGPFTSPAACQGKIYKNRLTLFCTRFMYIQVF